MARKGLRKNIRPFLRANSPIQGTWGELTGAERRSHGLDRGPVIPPVPVGMGRGGEGAWQRHARTGWRCQTPVGTG